MPSERDTGGAGEGLDMAALAELRYHQREPEAHNQNPLIQRWVYDQLTAKQQAAIYREWETLSKKRTLFKGSKFHDSWHAEGSSLFTFEGFR